MPTDFILCASYVAGNGDLGVVLVISDQEGRNLITVRELIVAKG